MNNASVTFLTSAKSKKAKTKASKRKLRKNSEKHIEERDDELPWPLPDDSAIAIYNELLGSNFKLTSFDPSNFLTSKHGHPVGKLNAQKVDKSLNGVQKMVNLEKYFGSNGFNMLGQPRCSPIQSTASNSNYAINFPCCSAKPVTPASSEDMCTLFQNSCHISSGIKGQLPPIGVFWDIENCSIPKGRSALVAVQRIRDRFFPGHLEAEFICVCDIRKESPGIIQELNDAQVTVVHVSGNSKNAADEKLRQAMRRFSDIYSGRYSCVSSPFPATVILISGDINFSGDLSDLRHRKKLYVILLGNKHTPDALLLCAHEHYSFHEMLGNLPPRPSHRDSFNAQQASIPLKGGLNAMDVLVMDLPYSNSKTQAAIKNRLKHLSENAGGKVITLQGKFALLRFPNKEAALRATKRMNGEDVLGSKIRVIYSSQMEFHNPDSGVAENSSTLRNPRVRELTQGSNPPSWKPTWRNNRSETYLSPSTPVAARSYNMVPISNQFPSFNLSPAVNTASNSLSPSVFQSKEDSPNKQRHTKSAKIVPIHSSTPLNNSIRPSLQQTVNSDCTHDQSADNIPLMNQENNGLVTVIPRLFSIPFAPSDSSNTNFTSNLNGIENLQPLAGSSLLGTPDSSFQLKNSPSNSTMRGKPQDAETFDLHVTNIDGSLGDWKVIRQTLMNVFAEHVTVKGIWVYISQDGAVSAVVRVNNKDEGHFAVAQFHRRKIGSKRIFISFDQGTNIDPETLKKEVASLLQDVPGSSLPLFKFREMFEKRYRRSVSASDLYRLREVVAISETGQNANTYNVGRTISLSHDWKAKDKNVSLYCSMHPPKSTESSKFRTGWAEKEADILLPNVMIELKQLTVRVNALLASHNGTLPLISFLDCYEAEYEKMEIVETGSGVPLEHLLGCVHGVEISMADSGMKRIQFCDKNHIDPVGNLTQPLATQLAQFGREMVDLLKTFPRCSLAFSKLIPAYHHHFGRQCRVADYGHFNLNSLLQTIPHVIQIMGAGQNRILSLSHKAQMKRFATDLLRVLKAHGGVKKQIKTDEFPQGFSQVFPNRQFLPEDYGLCYFSDLITELVENSTLVALVKDEGGNQMLAVPKREQTPQEIHRTRIFASEVVELFRHSIRYEMPFSKFIPAYHHHFGKQCRVSDYGFSKLAELFEAIADTVVCVAPPGPSSDFTVDDKMVRLVPQEQVKVVGEQLRNLLQTHTDAGKQVLLTELDELFIDELGFHLRPEMCDAKSIEDLVLNKLSSFIKLDNGIVTPVDQNKVRCLMQDVVLILEESPGYKMELEHFLKRFNDTYNTPLELETIKKQLNHMLILSEPGAASTLDDKTTIELAPIRIFAIEMLEILEAAGGSLVVSNVDAAYLQKHGRPLRPARMGYPSIVALLQAIPDVVQVVGKHRSKKVCVRGLDTSALASPSYHETPRSSRPRNIDSSSGFKDQNRNNVNHNNSRCHSVDQFRSYNNHLKMDSSGQWSESPKRSRAQPPPPLYLSSPAFIPRGQQGGPDVFTFDRAPQLSPPIYDMWMHGESLSPGSPPVSPPVVWTYHPIVYPPNTPPTNQANIMVPTFSFNGAWSPAMTSTCYDQRMPAQTNGAEYGYSEQIQQQTRLRHGMERLGLGLGMDGRNDA